MPEPVICLAACRRHDATGPEDLESSPDVRPLQEAFAALGARAEPRAWDDPRGCAAYDAVVLTSTWDSVDRPADYRSWVASCADATVVCNDAAFVEWSLDKTYLRDLEQAGIPIVPTTWLAPGETLSPLACEFVVKPSVSAGGRSTVRYAPGDVEAHRHVERLHEKQQLVMVQPYCKAVDAAGELNVVFLGGLFSHAVRKRPLLELGAGLHERPWEQMAWDGIARPSRRQLSCARRVVEAVSARLSVVPTYARVDLLDGLDGEPSVLEVELIDPYLSFELAGSAATRLAALVLDAIGARG